MKDWETKMYEVWEIEHVHHKGHLMTPSKEQNVPFISTAKLQQPGTHKNLLLLPGQNIILGTIQYNC